MSGHAWRERARKIVNEGNWPENISKADRQAVEATANGPGYEPYFTIKGVITLIEEGSYTPWVKDNEEGNKKPSLGTKRANLMRVERSRLTRQVAEKRKALRPHHAGAAKET